MKNQQFEVFYDDHEVWVRDINDHACVISLCQASNNNGIELAQAINDLICIAVGVRAE